MSKSSRRTFLKKASATAATLAASKHLPAFAAQGAPAKARVWSTFRGRRHADDGTLEWRPAKEIAPDAIVLDTGATKQEILGFGGALTDATCYVLSQLTEREREAVMYDFFAPGGLAMSVCRTCIGASDYSRTAYSFDESSEPDPELKKFSIDHDKEYILPVLRQARKVNSELFLFSSPWSPPGWMKTGGSLLGGAMRKASYAPYAKYFIKFLEGYKAEGVVIDAVTVQNEVDADQDGRMPACLWGQEYEIEFVKDHLGPALAKAGLGTKIWVLDHNYALWGRAIDELSDAEANQFIDGIAWHGYAGDVSAMTAVHNAFPRKNAYWTEGGPFYTQPDYQTDWAKWGETYNGILNNWARSITAWNLALDEKGEPNIGPFDCGGTITVDSGSHKVTQSGQYWAFAHFSKHVKRGAKVFATNGIIQREVHGDPTPLTHVGFRNPDGSHVVVLANRGGGKRIQLVLGSQALDIDVYADALMTVEWA